MPGVDAHVAGPSATTAAGTAVRLDVGRAEPAGAVRGCSGAETIKRFLHSSYDQFAETDAPARLTR